MQITSAEQLDWDPEIDTPATIAVIGGGPVGVEAALYARFLGYSVMLFDAAKVGGSLAKWGDWKMDASWAEVTSSLGLAALQAQGNNGELPPDQRVSYREYLERYLLPVARSDLIYDSVQINSRVDSISRLCCGAAATSSLSKRAELEFRLLIDSAKRGEYSQVADIVLDCSGLNWQHSGMASGGGLAVGQRGATAELLNGKVDVLGKMADRLRGSHCVLWGDDVTACANAFDVSVLAEQYPGTRLTWVLPKQSNKTDHGLSVPEQFPERVQQRLSEMLSSTVEGVACVNAWGIEAMSREQDRWKLRLQVGLEETLDIECDHVFQCSQPLPDWSFAGALDASSSDRLMITREPHYYVLGSKSHYGFEPPSMQICFQQIRTVFELVGGRRGLDLYQTVKPLG